MAFGLMTRKFGILQRAYSGRKLRRTKTMMVAHLMTRKFGILQRAYSGRKLRRTKTMMIAIARLHNFVINERLAKKDDFFNSPDNIHFNQPSTVHTASGALFTIIITCNVNHLLLLLRRFKQALTVLLFSGANRGVNRDLFVLFSIEGLLDAERQSFVLRPVSIFDLKSNTTQEDPEQIDQRMPH